MAALVCEICGGKLMAKSGGLFECEYCGMQYDKTRIQEMVQEIKGTVQVEGTVQVTGSVKIEGSATKESLLKRAFLELETGNWDEADTRFEQVLDIDPECANAYLGKLMAELHVRKQEKLPQLMEPFDDCENYKKALGFADKALSETLEEANVLIRRRIEREKQEKIVTSQKNAERLVDVRNKIQSVQGLICATPAACLGVMSNGSVISSRYMTPSGVEDWRGIVAVSGTHADSDFAVGLQSNGTVITSTRTALVTDYGQFNVDKWTDIVAIGAGHRHTVGLKSDGTVLAVGENNNSQCDVSFWHDIVAISAGDYHTVGLKADGTVIAMGNHYNGRCDTSEWRDIVAISAGNAHTVGLKADGTVVAVGNNEDGRLDVAQWNNIIAISAGGTGYHGFTVGLKENGTVVATGNNDNYQCDVSSWKNIVAISAGDNYTIGLRADGTVCRAGADRYNRYEVKDWKLFSSIKKLEEERLEARAALQAKDLIQQERRVQQEKEAEEKQRILQRRAKGLCQHCGGELKGLFSKKCVSCGKPKDY